MKATCFAILMSLFLSPILTHAELNPVDSSPPPGISQNSKTIHLNQADVDTISQSFKGIGPKRAEAIVAYREAHGGFKSIEELALVKGIGKQFVEKNLAQLQATYSLD